MEYGHPNYPCLICLCRSIFHAYQKMYYAYQIISGAYQSCFLTANSYPMHTKPYHSHTKRIMLNAYWHRHLKCPPTFFRENASLIVISRDLLSGITGNLRFKSPPPLFSYLWKYFGIRNGEFCTKSLLFFCNIFCRI